MSRHHPMNRSVDLVISLCGLIVFLPVLAIVTALVLIFDGWPFLYSQDRVGKGGKPFRILKFRTMSLEQTGPAITATDDSRITRLGRQLRRFKLDELPQLLNVVRGDMSLIGPRPEVPQYVNTRDPLWKQVLKVRPGITDVASLIYRNEEALLSSVGDKEKFYRKIVLPSKLRLNATYGARRSWWSDLKVLVLTVRYSFFPGQFNEDEVLRAFGCSREDLAKPEMLRERPLRANKVDVGS